MTSRLPAGFRCLPVVFCVLCELGRAAEGPFQPRKGEVPTAGLYVPVRLEPYAADRVGVEFPSRHVVVAGVPFDLVASPSADNLFLKSAQPLSEWPWLHGQRVPLFVGPVHGDPNCRNCLVRPDRADDIRLIDCGGYLDRGRLVSDLAIIERDVKLRLLGTEPEAKRYFDLNTRELSEWCSAERNSIEIGLNYDARDTPKPRSKGRSATGRAYQLVSLVRERAKQLRTTDDGTGRHYFAALLYWTLEALQHDAIPPTKKLLALYSAAKILEAFQSPASRTSD